MSLMGSSRHQVTLAYRDIPGLSWDVPSGILRTPSHTSLGLSQDCPGTSLLGLSGHQVIPGGPRTILECPLWDPLDTKSHQSLEMSLVGSSRHQVTPVFRDVPGLSWDVPCGIFRTPSDHSLDISLCLDYPGHPIMPRESWDMSDICRQH